MSNAMARPAPIRVEDYLEGETLTDIKHEYLDGEVVAMGGASARHGLVVTSLGLAIGPHARRKGCQLFIADMKVHVEAANSFFYPDILVTCDPRDRSAEASHVKRHPLLIVELLSPSTEAYDRGNKFAAYRTLAALQEYVLVSLEQRRIEVFRRDDSGHWVLYPFALDEQLELASVGLRCPVAEVFEGVEGE